MKGVSAWALLTRQDADLFWTETVSDMNRYGRPYNRSYDSYHALRHIEERQALSAFLGGIDKDVEELFLNLPQVQLESIFSRYGQDHGTSALSYARKTFPRWKSGEVQMSGSIAGRLLNLVPSVLDTSTRFDLVKKLRAAYFVKAHRYVTCEPQECRTSVALAVADLLSASDQCQLPENAVSTIRWLADGDVIVAQRLLVAAEQDEATARLRFLEAEFERIDFLLKSIQASKHVTHTIDLPQGTVTVSIVISEQGFWSWLRGLLF